MKGEEVMVDLKYIGQASSMHLFISVIYCVIFVFYTKM